MPIDAEAYMKGAIPSMSRGGSWLPKSPAPGIPDTSFALPGQPSRAPNGFGGSMVGGSQMGSANMFFNNPMWAPRTAYTFQPNLPSLAGSVQQRSASPPPTPGVVAPNGSLYNGSAQKQRSPVSPTSPHHPSPLRNGARLGPSASVSGLADPNPNPMKHQGWAHSNPDPVRSAAVNARHAAAHATQSLASRSAPRSVASSRTSAQNHRYRGEEIYEGNSWERHGGAPKPTTPEPAYERQHKPLRLPDGSLLSPRAASADHKGKDILRVSSPYRPLTPISEKGKSRNAREEPSNEFDAAFGAAVASSPRSRTPSRSRPQSPIPRGRATVPIMPADVAASASIPRPSRPKIGRRHTHDVAESPPPTFSTRSPTSFYPSSSESTHSPPGNPRRGRALAQRQRTTPLRPRFAEGGYSSLTYSDASSSSSSFGMGDLGGALPSLPVETEIRTPMSSKPPPPVRTKTDAPPGYISPLHDDPYDRYSAHPAAHDPNRIKSGSIIAGQSVTSRVTSDTHLVDDHHGTTYLPVGFARPTKEVPWNRDGPAMKTYGVAWKKDAGGGMPDGPDGPRWDVARPPTGETREGGSWWASGGQAF